MEELRRSWGERVSEARTKRELSQRQLAELVGASQSAINHIERGRVAPRDVMKMKLALALSTSVEELFPYAKGETL